jgi:hypothetical protein
MEVPLIIVIGVACALFYFASSYQRRKNDMRLMAKILADRQGREERWKEAVDLDLALGDGEFDIRELHKETLEAEERFIEAFRERYGAPRA